MSFDPTTTLYNVAMHCLIIPDRLNDIRKEIKQSGLGKNFKAINGKDCSHYSFNEEWVQKLGIEKIKESLKSIENDLDLIEMSCKEISQLNMEDVDGGEFLEFGKNIFEISVIARSSMIPHRERLKKFNQRIGKFDDLISSHIQYRLLEEEITKLLMQCQTDNLVHLTLEELEGLGLLAENLAVSKKIFRQSGSHSCSGHFPTIHSQEMENSKRVLTKIKENLAEAKKTLNTSVGEKIELILVNLDVLCNDSSYASTIDIQKTFLQLPVLLRSQIFEKAGIAEIDIQIEDHSSPTVKTAPLARKMNNRRSRSSSRSIRVAAMMSNAHSAVAEQNKKEIKKEPTTPLAKLFVDPQLALMSMIVALEEYPGNYLQQSIVAEIVQRRCNKKTEEPVININSEENTSGWNLVVEHRNEYANCFISSLQDLKAKVRIISAYNFTNGDEEEILQLLLNGAEKGGAAVEGEKGVYYWVWYLAHEKDPNAGGDNYGRIQAPKDAERLLAAIDKVIEL